MVPRRNAEKRPATVGGEEIIPIYQVTDSGEKVIVGRELHQYLDVGRDFSTWINSKISEYNYQEGIDFSTVRGKSNGGRPRKEYILTLDMGKELGMLNKGDKGNKIRQYFIQFEKKVRKEELDVPETKAEALRLAANILQGLVEKS